MNDTTTHSEDPMANASREEIMAALFANMVIQQTNMAMMLMGKAPHPETGQLMKDMEAARMFIDQVEMLEAKTKGNLNKQEEGLLKQALAALHMAFVEAMDEPGTLSASAPQQQRVAPSSAPEASPAPAAQVSPAPAAPPTPPAEVVEESRKKFSKKY
jgi:Domain of unknown function (DUF1844)